MPSSRFSAEGGGRLQVRSRFVRHSMTGAAFQIRGQRFIVVIVRRRIASSLRRSTPIIEKLTKAFQNLPVVLVAQDARGHRVVFRGPDNLVHMIRWLSDREYPWQEFRFSVSSSGRWKVLGFKRIFNHNRPYIPPPPALNRYPAWADPVLSGRTPEPHSACPDGEVYPIRPDSKLIGAPPRRW